MAAVLSRHEAKCIYRAMLALNEAHVESSFKFSLPTAHAGRVTIRQCPDTWQIQILLADGTIIGRYENQIAFALDHGAAF
jgi:hypothetical protein